LPLIRLLLLLQATLGLILPECAVRQTIAAPQVASGAAVHPGCGNAVGPARQLPQSAKAVARLDRPTHPHGRPRRTILLIDTGVVRVARRTASYYAHSGLSPPSRLTVV